MNILKSVGSYGGLTIISRVLGYLRDILIAIFIGTSYLADAFLLLLDFLTLLDDFLLKDHLTQLFYTNVY